MRAFIVPSILCPSPSSLQDSGEYDKSIHSSRTHSVTPTSHLLPKLSITPIEPLTPMYPSNLFSTGFKYQSRSQPMTLSFKSFSSSMYVFTIQTKPYITPSTFLTDLSSRYPQTEWPSLTPTKPTLSHLYPWMVLQSPSYILLYFIFQLGVFS